MHDVTASEGAHRFFVKKAINRVRKGTDYDTSTSSVDWVFRVRTWAKVIDDVQGPSPPKRRRKEVKSVTVFFNRSKMVTPTEGFTAVTGQYIFAPLRTGGDRLLCNDARLSYHELGQLVSSFTGWEKDIVYDGVEVELYCSAEICYPGKERRTYWATEHRYLHNAGTSHSIYRVSCLHMMLTYDVQHMMLTLTYDVHMLCSHMMLTLTYDVHMLCSHVRSPKRHDRGGFG